MMIKYTLISNLWADIIILIRWNPENIEPDLFDR